MGRPGGERTSRGPRAAASGRTAAAEAARAARGCGRRGELLPRPLTPSAELESGRGGVRGAGPGGELLRVRPERTLGARVRRSRELCGGAAGVEAAEGCMSGARAARRAAAVRSGPWSRRREEATEEPGKREEGARAGRESSPALGWTLRCWARAGPRQQVGSVASTPRRRRPRSSSSGALCGGEAPAEHSEAGWSQILICRGIATPENQLFALADTAGGR